MGGLWVDYELMSTLPGQFVIGEANFSDHGANRLGASALLQGLADGYFIAPLTVSAYLAGCSLPALPRASGDVLEALARAEARITRLLAARGRRAPLELQAELGELLWNGCGLARDARGLTETLAAVRELRERFWQELRVTGGVAELNPELELAGRVADALELGELMLLDALAPSIRCCPTPLRRSTSGPPLTSSRGATLEGSSTSSGPSLRNVASAHWICLGSIGRLSSTR